MKNAVKGIMFYVSLVVLILFVSGGYASLSFYFPALGAFCVIAGLWKTHSDKEIFKFTGVAWLENLNIIKKTFGENSFTEE